MSPIAISIVALLCLVLGYRFYSKYLASQLFQLEDDEPVPAIEHEDGVDFVPTSKEVLWGHHFASIAGAAPILGPAMAILWGWVPAMCWIVFGVIFMGAAHDFGALALSIRHGGRSVGDLTERFIGPRSRLLFQLVIFFLIWLVGAVFAFAIAGLFVAFPASILPVNLEIAVAVAIGFACRGGKRSLLIPSILALLLLYGTIFGTASGHLWVPGGDSIFLDLRFWLVALMVYAFVASSLPVWMLLQPRDLINSHQLLVGLAGLYLGFFLTNPEFAAPAVGPIDQLPDLFPLLFVTIACGAISGFHGLVSSGTTSKQLACATDARPIGYGGMLCEASLAILATMAVATGVWRKGEGAHGRAYNWLAERSAANGGGSGRWGLPQVSEALQGFVQGSAGFLEELGIDFAVGSTIVAVIVISFAATSLDTALRIQRLVLAEIGEGTGVRPLRNRWVGGSVACGSVLLLIWADFSQGAKSLWPVFGATNQLLAGFTLLICALYLKGKGRNPWAYMIPSVVVMAITFYAIVLQVRGGLRSEQWLVAGVGAVIGLLASWVAIEGVLAWRSTASGSRRGSALGE